jgi:hypothetical protein
MSGMLWYYSFLQPLLLVHQTLDPSPSNASFGVVSENCFICIKLIIAIMYIIDYMAIILMMCALQDG